MCHSFVLKNVGSSTQEVSIQGGVSAFAGTCLPVCISIDSSSTPSYKDGHGHRSSMYQIWSNFISFFHWQLLCVYWALQAHIKLSHDSENRSRLRKKTFFFFSGTKQTPSPSASRSSYDHLILLRRIDYFSIYSSTINFNGMCHSFVLKKVDSSTQEVSKNCHLIVFTYHWLGSEEQIFADSGFTNRSNFNNVHCRNLIIFHVTNI